ncbi:hypothetical protein Dda3937_04536 [Dickeya dadantii 3937]|uniref:Uncharacterized protein n=1 Tax=Dickeya dadantii (strain 3937) TaxID=198628 RepID=E0SK62_DICD3|nr:hypothetical protein Dda3937_04536 [Dickeya dadantii 3937]
MGISTTTTISPEHTMFIPAKRKRFAVNCSNCLRHPQCKHEFRTSAPRSQRTSIFGPVRSVPDIVIHTLRITLLSDSGYALTGYEYCARIM